MTYQRDPNRVRRAWNGDEGSWSAISIVLLIAAIIGIGYILVHNISSDTTRAPTRTTEQSVPTPPATRPTPTNPKQ